MVVYLCSTYSMTCFVQELRKQGILEDRLQLLVNVTGAFRPGVLTALVGVSGAGKTTLMDFLSQHLSGRKIGGLIEGSITIDGHPKNQETFVRIAGYCEQDNIHSPCMTVHESLLYSAWLRLPSCVDLETEKVFVDEVMDLVEFTSLSDALVGQPGVDGLSTEQRKRLTIATELVANPSVVFMDEPTSGLDARAAAIVMRTVRNIADTGQTTVCTIHQPSIDIFESFDEVPPRGGELIYAGPLGTNSKNLIEYLELVRSWNKLSPLANSIQIQIDLVNFTRVDGFNPLATSIDGVPKMKAGYNPATWMLEVTSPAQESQLGANFAELYRKSPLFQYSLNLLTVLQNPVFDAAGDIINSTGCCRGRQQDLSNAMGSKYAAVIFMGITNATAVQPVVSTSVIRTRQDRPVRPVQPGTGLIDPGPYNTSKASIKRLISYRERAATMYSALPFALAQHDDKRNYTQSEQRPHCCCTILYAVEPLLRIHNLSQEPIKSESITLLTPLNQSLPGWWRWYYWANPISWSLYGLLTSQYGDMDKPIKIWDGSHSMSIRHFLEHYFGFQQDFLGLSGFMVIGFTMLFALIFAFAIKSLNFQKR
ncbi:hypothetical protein ACLOJK_019958 [Asimina triloba]